MGIVRFLLALAVVIGHSGPIFGLSFIDGWKAVEIFFMISGFYMALILNEKYIGSGSYFKFISNRLLRIYPLYWIVLTGTLLASIISGLFAQDWLFLASFVTHGKALITTIELAVLNLILIGQDIVLFTKFTPEGMLNLTRYYYAGIPPLPHNYLLVPQAWSLSLELMFYILAPIIVRKKTQTIIAMVILSLLLRVYFSSIGLNEDSWSYRFFPLEIAFFLLGAVSYKIYSIYKLSPWNSLIQKIILIATISAIIFYHRFPGSEIIKQWIMYAFCVFSLPIIFHMTKNISWDRIIGELSYPIYLSHYLIVVIAVQLLNINNEWLGLIVVATTILISYLLYIFVVLPINNIRQRRIM